MLFGTNSTMSEWLVEYHPEIARDLRQIDEAVWLRIRKAIDVHYARLPSPGKPLTHELRNYRTFRVGNWRAIGRLKGSTLTIFVVQHRNKGYGPDLIRTLKRRDLH